MKADSDKRKKGVKSMSRKNPITGNSNWQPSEDDRVCTKHLEMDSPPNEYGINANYPSNHHNYYSAWTYVTKQDENFVESAGHPDLKNAAEPKTSRNNKRKRNREPKEEECTEGCDGLRMICAEEILANNQVPLKVFCDPVCDVPIQGRGKYRNIMLTGHANCGKTFFLNPLTLIFDTFCNPASGSFAWVGVQNAECIFLNDFRWSPQVIPWHDLLLMLEVTPRYHVRENLGLCTSKNGIVDERECGMMDVRWKIFHFTYHMRGEQQQQLPSCASSPPTSLYAEGLWLSCSLSFWMPPKRSKWKTAPLTTRRQSKRRSTQQIGHAVEATEPSSQPCGSAGS
ncbi:hypothetical protein P5673_014132 [Acropora cervicornis]|uniref:Uncharacterized protein n=1 Tax=Acropora cervicornis TaxID=6130 RepID=A0AAD9V5X4_ACRCE|nr:hypothetical protein P5673_014132 [Acropora cervicornis]